MFTSADFDSTTAKILATTITRIRHNYSIYNGLFPSYGDGDKKYLLTENKNWLASFWSGLLWLSCAQTGDKEDCVRAKSTLASFEARLDKAIHLNHDLGFLFLLSARAQYIILGDEDAKKLALRAADVLYKRFRPVGQYIQAWGELDDEAKAGRIIIDTMMNLPLLFWASDMTGDEKYRSAAIAHAKTSQQYLIRDDYSSYHTYFFNPDDGSPIGGKTHQGYADESFWARGQAWAVYGFTMVAEWTGDESFIVTAKAVARRYLEVAPITDVAPYDFSLPDTEPKHPDSSADAIVAGGLLRLAKLTGDARYRQQAETLLTMLYEKAFDERADAQGLLLHGTQHAPQNYGVDTYTIFGDYFFLEAIMTLNGTAHDFWGK